MWFLIFEYFPEVKQLRLILRAREWELVSRCVSSRGRGEWVRVVSALELPGSFATLPTAYCQYWADVYCTHIAALIIIIFNFYIALNTNVSSRLYKNVSKRFTSRPYSAIQIVLVYYPSSSSKFKIINLPPQSTEEWSFLQMPRNRMY